MNICKESIDFKTKPHWFCLATESQTEKISYLICGGELREVGKESNGMQVWSPNTQRKEVFLWVAFVKVKRQPLDLLPIPNDIRRLDV